MTLRPLLSLATFSLLTLAACRAPPPEPPPANASGPRVQATPLPALAASAAFVEEVGANHMFQVLAADLALHRGQSPAVLRYAASLKAETPAARDNLRAAISASGRRLLPPGRLPKPLQARIYALTTVPKPAFEAAYVEAQLETQAALLRALERYAETGDLAALRTYAGAAAAPTRARLEAAQALRPRAS